MPGSENPKYVSDQDHAGRDGSYRVEFTFQPNALLKADFGKQELRSGFIGDSHLIISDPLPENTDKKHVFTLEAPKK